MEKIIRPNFEKRNTKHNPKVKIKSNLEEMLNKGLYTKSNEEVNEEMRRYALEVFNDKNKYGEDRYELGIYAHNLILQYFPKDFTSEAFIACTNMDQ